MKCSKLVVALSLGGLFLWLFGAVLFNGQSFGFRDSAYYYYPLFEWTASEWGEGRVPLWNPLDNCGTPIVADSTSSIFYPGKLVFALPIAFYWRFKLYVFTHVLLAALAALMVARRWKASWFAAAICSMSYAFGGYVLFQHCNIVFLVSAAWLPFAVLLAERMLVRRSFVSALGFGCMLALMVLGGDPQTAYHAGLVAVLYASMLWRRERKAAKGTRGRESETHRLRASWRSRPVLLAFGAVVGAGLAALQILPSTQWARGSQRALYEEPRCVYEAAEFLTRSEAVGGESSNNWRQVRQGILDGPTPGTHHDHIYQFSLGPWRLTEFVWPNVSGRMYPINQRWTNVIPGEDRIWTPSLYVGLLPLLLGLSAVRLRRGRVRERWLSWCAILATVGSFGWYGFGWLLQEIQVGLFDAGPESSVVGEPVGGLYWLMVVFLPGYVQFRFPAKLLVVTSLVLSLLAARGWDRAMLRPSTGLQRMLIVIACVSAGGLVCFFVGTPLWYDWVSQAPGDDVWGPLDAYGALRSLRFTLATTVCVSLVCLWLLRVRGMKRGVLARYVPHLLLVVAAVDIAVANRWMIAAVDDRLVTESPQVVETLSASKMHEPDSATTRIYRGNPDRWVPAQWRWNWSPDRITENYAWQRSTVYPRHHLSARLAYANSSGTFTPADHAIVIGVSSSHGVERPDGIAEPHSAILSALSVEYLLLPEGTGYPVGHHPIESPTGEQRPKDLVVWHNPDCFPRCWIVRDTELLKPIDSNDPGVIASRTREVLFPGGQVRDLLRSAVVESEQATLKVDSAESASSESDRCAIVVDEPGLVELAVRLEAPAMLVLNDYYYPGWTATLETAEKHPRQIEILRTNRTMRGVVLPKGDHRLVFAYRPVGFLVGAIVSAVSWLLVAFVTGGACCQLANRSRRLAVGATSKR